ncbi:hypothetical protein GRF29_8g1765939 [Pseudopithomyces chartarum]|uniref:Major facilitator superfamily (MFS) profile domain-containing protein n=1 Tax=Pseudopithomyces chartarum TaxID=1892770 RepID=A0AAN6RKM8_9PLEO|nr:hypothetical protein GRF29_8g1765939 [Pseudopithomyces chartarum]
MDRNNTEQETLALLRADASINEEAGRGSHESFIAEGNPSDEVAEFAQIYNLSHKLDHLRKASLLIQGNTSIHELPAITEDEIEALQAETESKWRQPLRLYLTITVTALGAMGQGWAQTSMNGANLYFPKAFGIDTDTPRNNLILGIINSGIYISNGLLGAWLVSPLNRKLGRRGAVFLAAAVSCLSNIGGALTQNWQQLLFFRLVLGCALGIISSTLNVYAAECVPAAIRGGLAVSWQMFCAFGIFIGFVANMAVYDFGPNTWRLQIAGPFLSTIPLLCLIYVCPESPAWHLKHGGRYDLAYYSLAKLRNTELQAAREIYSLYLQRPTKVNVDSSYLQQISELFTIPRIRRATLAAYTVMISQQLCGINIISFYSSTIFADADFSTFGALLASTVFGFINFVGAFPAVWTMDTLGRRSLLLLTLPFMALTMLAASLSFSIENENPAHLWLLASMIYLFCAEYSPGMGPVPAAYTAEVFPLSHREIGVSSAVAMTNIWASALSLTFPALLSTLGSQESFMLYAVLNVVALVLVFLFVPETRLKTLEELDQVFMVPTRRFVVYQVTEYLPWWFERYVLQRNKAELKPVDGVGGYQELEQDFE